MIKILDTSFPVCLRLRIHDRSEISYGSESTFICTTESSFLVALDPLERKINFKSPLLEIIYRVIFNTHTNVVPRATFFKISGRSVKKTCFITFRLLTKDSSLEFFQVAGSEFFDEVLTFNQVSMR